MSINNPQLEDGYTPVVNSIMEALARTQLSGYEWRVLLFLLRKTYGWSKKSDIISLGQFQDGTGLDRRNVAKTIKRLIRKRIITTTSVKMNTSKLSQYTFNKHFGEWLASVKLNTTSVDLGTGGSVDLDTLGSVDFNTHNINSDNINLDKKEDCADEEKSGAPPLDDLSDIVIKTKTKSDKALQVTTSAPYLLASWFYSSRGVPAEPTSIDMHHFKVLLQLYSESVIKQGVQWRLSHDPEGFWQTHITSAAVHRQFGNWMSESSVKAISLKQWLDRNPDLDYRKFTTELASADGFMRAFNEAKKNRLVYFEDADYTMYQKAIRIKTRETKAQTEEAKR